MQLSDNVLAEIFSFVSRDGKSISSLRLVSSLWVTVLEETSELSLACTSSKKCCDGFAIVNAPSSLGQRHPTVVVIPDVSRLAQVRQTQRYVNAALPRFEAQGVKLQLVFRALHVDTSFAIEEIWRGFRSSDHLEIELEPAKPLRFDQLVAEWPRNVRIQQSTLDLSGQCNFFTHEGLKSIASRHQFETFNLSRNPLVTDETLEVISTFFPSTKHLFLHQARGFTDEGMHFIGELLGVETIELDGCDQITDRGIRLLIYGRSAVNAREQAES